MDPNAALNDLREWLAEGNVPSDTVGFATRFGAVMAAFEALDTWLSRGGFLPEDWLMDPAPGRPLTTEEYLERWGD